MSGFRYPPKYYERPRILTERFNYATVTPELLVELQQDAEAVNARNKEKREEMAAKLKQAVELVAEVFGENDNATKYLKRLVPPFNPYSSSFSDFRHRVEDTQKKEKEARKQADREKERNEWTEKAVAYLTQHLKIGVDFNLSNAVEVANELAAKLEIERRIAEIKASGDLIDFSGNNCDEVSDEGGSCAGWDGESRRCECGNRRVNWATGWGHTFLYPSVYAEAY